MKLSKEERAKRDLERFQAMLAVPRQGFAEGAALLESLETIPSQVPPDPIGLELSSIQWLRPLDLKIHPLNERYFQTESPDYFEKLTSDIKERGILVPLVVKLDGTVLAGHNRLRIALEVGLSEVPVQKVISDLTAEREKEFLIKDNLLRRQLTVEEKKKLIIELYGAEIEQLQKGGDRGNQHTGGKVQMNFASTAAPLPDRIEKETGIKAGTAKRIIAAVRREKGIGSKARKKALSGADQKRVQKLQTQLQSLNSIEETVQKKLEKIRAEKRIVVRELKAMGGQV
ncbi:MAG: ParB N-terminal domain-containing protein [Spirochaetales bacterium]|nr:ParB N-terminal domain-containing protein [Spirochaetales bacterium]